MKTKPTSHSKSGFVWIIVLFVVVPVAVAGLVVAAFYLLKTTPPLPPNQQGHIPFQEVPAQRSPVTIGDEGRDS